MGDLLTLPVITSLDLPADRVLEAAKGKLKAVVILGFEQDEEGSFYFASSKADGGDILWLIENLKANLLNLAREE
jgi:hypothetical protein